MEKDPGIPMVRNDRISNDIPDLPPPLPTSPIPDEEVEKENYKPVEIEEGGLNGMILRSLTKVGTLACDKIQPGDYLVAVNGKNMRNISRSQALAVLKM